MNRRCNKVKVTNMHKRVGNLEGALTPDILILIHLAQCDFDKPIWDCTLRGMSENLNIPYPTAAKMLKDLITKGLVVEREDEYEGNRKNLRGRHVKTFGITYVGRERLKEIKEALP